MASGVMIQSPPQLIDELSGGGSFGLRQQIGLLAGSLVFLVLGLGLPLEAQARWAAATVALMSVWWITEPLPLWATACLPLIIFPIAGVGEWRWVILQYFDPLNFLFLGGMLIAAAMEQWGLHRRVALGVVGSIGASPRRIVLGFMLATGFISLWISNTAAAVMMFPIAMAVLLKFQEQAAPGDLQVKKFGLALMLGIAYSASIGGMGTKIGTGTNAIFINNVKPLNLEIDFLTWLKVGMPVVLITLPLVWLYLVRIAAPLPAQEFPGTREAIHEARSTLGRMNFGERIAGIAFVSAALLWIFRRDMDLSVVMIPGWSRLIPFSVEDVVGQKLADLPKPLARVLGGEIGDAGVALCCALPLLLIPVQSKPLRMALSLRTARGISWGLLVMLGGGFAMAYGIQASGLAEVIKNHLGQVATLPPFVAMLLVCMIATLMTEVASNTATASILLPIISASHEHFGVHTAPLMMGITLSASFGFMLPAGTPPNAVAYSSGYITAPEMARCGIIVDIFGTILVAVICYFLAPLALGLVAR
jgi:solute carrier family 13 (sodium-dependent dicarboxylate transporter), member 2/3/5